MMNRPRTQVVFLALVLAVLGGCRDSDPPPRPVLIFAAASTKDAVAEAAAAFTQQSGIAVKISDDDSSRLAAQIVNGAPADLFLSANEKWADHVKEKGLAQASLPLFGNTLVLVVPRGNPAKVAKPADLTGPTVKRVAVAGPTVPAGIYARQALKALDVWDQLGQRVVSGENVRVTLTYVERDEVEAGIVYATDAKISDRVEQVYAFAGSTHDPIRYPLVLLERGADHPAARRFCDFLASPEAAKIFTKHGFTRLENP
jgi:molybdate transport system substrate-binding protein